MRDYGQIQCSIWGNPEFKRLSDDAKLILFYLLAGTHSNGLGCYRLPYGYVSCDTGKGIDTVSKGFLELQKIGFSYHCDQTEFVVIPKYLKWNPVSNKKVAIARQKEFQVIPEIFQYIHVVANDIINFGKHFEDDFISRIETLSIPYRNPIDTVVGSRSETLSKQEPNLTEPNRTLPVPSESGLGDVDPETGEVLQWRDAQ